MTALYKVHTVYKKEDVLKMQKLVGQRFQLIYRCIAIVVEIILLAVCLWSRSGGSKIQIFGISLTVAAVILLIAVAASLIIVELRPYQATRQILKDKKDKVIKANYYFYKKGFQYGWGDRYLNVSYSEIKHIEEREEGWFFKAGDVVYWVKNTDFERGDSKTFGKFIESCVGADAWKKR